MEMWLFQFSTQASQSLMDILIIGVGTWTHSIPIKVTDE